MSRDEDPRSDRVAPELALDLTIPDELPVAAWADELRRAIEEHQVVVVAGETGSGKSTQLPKLCLRAGRTAIGHTQPRRIAARSVAERVAAEVGCAVGDEVGFAVRFTDRVSDRTAIKLMTDGILLNELQRDRDLRRYDTLIIDEAHERSLNIDFLLGYLARLLPRRPDLKVIVTSATIDTARFAHHFGGAPVIEVSGRTFPVEVRYRPSEDGDDVAAIVDAVRELQRDIAGDILVFASGEREIRDTIDALDGAGLRDTELVPLFSRLSAAEQHRVFAPHSGRRIVVATNIAETSVTVPGITAVVDPGTARVSRYNKRTRVQRLPIEPVSQASADQRAGRCGRIAPGICIRLYAEDDYDARPEFTEPEVLRTNLASVILQMAALGLGEVADFPFVEPPDARQIADGIALLEDLGALDEARITPLGRRLARLPLDPTFGRMVLEAERYGAVHEVMVLAAAMSIQDVRERPVDDAERAAASHARFRVPGSDFATLLALWDHVRDRQRTLSSGAFRRECRAEYLHHARIREWQDVYTQLRQVARSLKLRIDREPADIDGVHRALLAGLIGNVGTRIDPDERSDPSGTARPGDGRGRPRRGSVEFQGARNARFSIGRGSVLARRPPRWVVAGELVETNRMWAHQAATVQPAWIEHAAAHLVTRSHHSPAWNPERGRADVVERVQFRSLVLVAGRRVALAPIDSDLARDLFLRHALVRGEWDREHAFVAANAAAIADAEALEERLRRRDLLVDEDELVDWFAARVPPDIADVRAFDRWWRDRHELDPDLLTLTEDDLVDAADDDLDVEEFPTAFDGGTIDYRFEPGTASDGAVFEIPLAALNRTDPAPFDWLVPGLRVELVTAMIKALPKATRRHLAPAPATAEAVVARIDPADGALRPVLAAALADHSGRPVRAEDWDGVELPTHLRPHFRILGPDGVLAEGPDLEALDRRLRAHVRAEIVARVAPVERDGLTAWDVGTLDRVVRSEIDGHVVEGFPAMVDLGDAVGIRVLASADEQRALHWNGVRRLLALSSPRPARLLQSVLPASTVLALTDAPHATVSAAATDLRDAVLDRFLLEAGGAPFDEAGFEALRARTRAELGDALARSGRALAAAVHGARRVAERLGAEHPDEWAVPIRDMRAQLDRLVFDGMAVTIGDDRIEHLARYVEGIGIRLDRLRKALRTDLRQLVEIANLEREWQSLVAEHGLSATLDDLRWDLEELRVQSFAQQLGTATSVSAPRIRRALADVRRGAGSRP